ncbi:MAG: helix-turn-helix domain-containing protein [Actinomycetota bacterium]
MMKVREVGKFIRDQRRTASLSLRKLSTLAGVSNPYLSQVERGLRKPSADILKEIAKALSISAETLYIKAGILEDRNDVVDVVGTLRRDPSISEKQKQIIVDLYQSFRSPAPAAARIRKRASSKPATATKRVAASRKTSSRSKPPAKKKKTSRSRSK